MNRIKKMSMFFILAILTCCIVFIPQLISGQNEANLLNKTIYRSCNVGNRAKVTSEQVARLYCDREISIGYNSAPINIENSDTSSIRESVQDLVEFIFGENEVICEQIREILTESSVWYSRNSNLIKIDNQPIALNFIEIVIKEDTAYLDILYEEKTKTIIRFSYDFLGTVGDSKNDVDLFLEKIELAVKDYYKNLLGLNDGNYYYVFEIQNITANGKDDSYIQFGILQSAAEIDKAEAILFN